MMKFYNALKQKIEMKVLEVISDISKAINVDAVEEMKKNCWEEKGEIGTQWIHGSVEY